MTRLPRTSSVGEPVEITLTHVIRVPANRDDSLLCDQLARHMAMAVRRPIVDLPEERQVHVRAHSTAVKEKRRVDTLATCMAVLAATGSRRGWERERVRMSGGRD
jgi:hypothetical protein